MSKVALILKERFSKYCNGIEKMIFKENLQFYKK